MARSTEFLTAATILVGAAACTSPNAPNRDDFYTFRQIPPSKTDSITFRWTAAHLPVRYWAEDIGIFPEIVARGLSTWESQFLYGEFQAVLVDDSSTADVIVLYGGLAFPEGSLNGDTPVESCFGVTSVPEIVGDTFADKLVSQVTPAAGFAEQDVLNCLLRVATHELGHTLGILTHSLDPDDIMFVTPLNQSLSDADRNTINTLYHSEPSVAPFRRGQ